MAGKKVPRLTQLEVSYLRCCPKRVPVDWSGRLRHCVKYQSSGKQQGRLLIATFDGASSGNPSHLAGTFYGTVRIGSVRSDFSVGMLFEDEDGNSYNVVRCNGAAHVHRNVLTGRRLGGFGTDVTPHVHYLTSAMFRTSRLRRSQPENFAIGVMKWSTVEEAIRGMMRRSNIIELGQGVLL